MSEDPRRHLPAVDRLVREAAADPELAGVGRAVLVASARELLADARTDGQVPTAGWQAELKGRVRRALEPTLVPVINASGVVLHTNLGRAPLPEAAVAAIEAVSGYNTLEYDLAAGRRGSRQAHVRSLLRQVTGAEDAGVVTNAAAALYLLLNTLSAGGETIVSRGELVEIGGSFRIPEILARSGASLIAVGATNRTRLRDFELALSPRTRCALQVHRSNFSQIGFTEDVPLADLVTFMGTRDLPVVFDAGSGLLLDLSSYGLRGEPLIPSSVQTGATVVFSGDKLLGGPQAGIIAGPHSVLARAMENPLARALRPDKIVFAALEATLRLYLDPATALRKVPALAMLIADKTELEHRASVLRERIPGAHTEPGTSAVGGGAFAGTELPTTLVVVPTDHPDDLAERLRTAAPRPIITRTGEGKLLLDPRTVRPDEMDALVEGINASL